MTRFKFTVNRAYTRAEIKRAVGADADARGGDWATGYVVHDGAYFVFCGVGTAGRTGHDYGNHFDGDELVWKGKTSSRRGQPMIDAMTGPAAEVHLFWREHDRDPFTYAGRAYAVSVGDDVPVTVRWRFQLDSGAHVGAPDELSRSVAYREGAVRQVLVNSYERDPAARLACIRHHGTKCAACGFDFVLTYGELGEGFIHVHHVKPVSLAGDSFSPDPVRDLIPVCPNCHWMLHREDPPIDVARLRVILAEAVAQRIGGAAG